MKTQQAGFFRKDILVILIAGVALLGLFSYYAIKGEPVPVWQAVLVGVVNIVAAAKLFLTVKKAREQLENERQSAQKKD